MTDTAKQSYFQQRMAEIDADESLRSPEIFGHRNVTKETTRHGHTLYYYREGKGKRYRLPDPNVVGKLAFKRARDAAASGNPIAIEKPIKPTGPKYLNGPSTVGYVYFIKMGNAVKIGFSTSTGNRLQAIQTSCPEPAELIKVVPGTMSTEFFFHDHFAKYRLRGEWFSLEGDLVAFLF